LSIEDIIDGHLEEPNIITYVSQYYYTFGSDSKSNQENKERNSLISSMPAPRTRGPSRTFSETTKR
jgi:hypothetical protein